MDCIWVLPMVLPIVYTICMTKLISLKLDEKLLQEVQRLADAAGTSRNQYINAALKAHNEAQKREQFIQKLKKDVELIRESSMEVLIEFEALEDDYEQI